MKTGRSARTRLTFAIAPLAGLISGMVTIASGGTSIRDQAGFFALFVAPALFAAAIGLAIFDRRWGWAASVPLLLAHPFGWLFADTTGWTYILAGIFIAVAIAASTALRGVKAVLDVLTPRNHPPISEAAETTWITLVAAPFVGLVAALIASAWGPIDDPGEMAAALIIWLAPIGLALTFVDRRWGWLAPLPLAIGQFVGLVLIANPALARNMLPFYCGPALLAFGIAGALLAGVLRLLQWSVDALRGRPARPRPGCCLDCGYNLTGNVSGVCPECGRKLTGPRLETSPVE